MSITRDFLTRLKPMATILELAQMSKAIYDIKTPKDFNDGTAVKGWSCTRFQPASGALNGFQAACFKRSGETVIAFRGTDQKMDVVADLKLGTGLASFFASVTPDAKSVCPTGNRERFEVSLGNACRSFVISPASASEHSAQSQKND